MGHATCCGGGWPYMHYWTKETGYAGKQYEKQTSDRICVELGCNNKIPCEDNPGFQCCSDDPKWMRKCVFFFVSSLLVFVCVCEFVCPGPLFPILSMLNRLDIIFGVVMEHSDS